MKFFIEDFISKCDQICSLMENFIFCAVKNKQHVRSANVVSKLFKSAGRNISKLYVIARGHLFPVYDLGNECARMMFQPKYHWVEIKYLGAIQNRCRQFFCLCDNAFSQYTSVFTSAVVACRLGLGRLHIYSIYIQISR